MSRISGSTVVLTGAASGIGRHTALALARRGARLLVVDRDAEGLDTLAAELPAPGEIVGRVVTDLGVRAGVEAVVDAALALPAGVDIVINNAGICVVAPVEETTLDDIDRLIAVNLTAVMGITQGLLPSMLARGRGHVVNIASASGLAGIPGFVAYGTTKFGVVGYSEGLRNELGGRGIRVTAVCPGVVNTPLIQNLKLTGYDEAVRTAIPGYSQERIGEDIAKAIARNKPVIAPAGKTMWLGQRYAPTLLRHVLGSLQSRLLAPHRQ